MNTIPTTPKRAGVAVTDSRGRIGVVTESFIDQKRGWRAGKVSVIWLGSHYSVMEDPAELNRVELVIAAEATK